MPQEIIDILGPAPVLNEQEEKIHHAMLARFAKEIAPKDLISWFLLKDLADYYIEIARYRRLKAVALQYAQARRVRDAISRLATDCDKEVLQLEKRAQDTYNNEAQSIKGAEELAKGLAQIKEKLDADVLDAAQRCAADQDALRKHEMTEADLIAGFIGWSDQYEKLDRFLELTERRLIMARRELEKHLDGFGQSMRKNVENVIEAEATEIESNEVPLSPVTSKDGGA